MRLGSLVSRFTSEEGALRRAAAAVLGPASKRRAAAKKAARQAGPAEAAFVQVKPCFFGVVC